MHPHCTHTLEAEAQCVCVLFLTDICHFIKIHEGLWCNIVFLNWFTWTLGQVLVACITKHVKYI